MINSLNPLNELSDIYLGNISEDNSPEAIKARVMQHVRAIRYRARKEGETLNKAYNEFMGGQSGISSTEKQMVKERLGLTGGAAHVGEGYQRDPEQSKKDRTHSSQPDPSKDGFTGIGNMSIKDIMKMNSKIKAKSKKESVEPEDEMVEGVGDAVKKGVKRHKDAVEKKKIKNRKAVPYAALAAEHQPEGEMVEAKVDKGRSDYGKASIRNYRRSGPGHGEPAMFDPENKRGKTIDKRREEHKERRGKKGAKVPAYKVEETQVDEATRLKKEKGYDKGGTKKPSATKDKALSFVLDKIRKEHGKGAVMGQGGSRQKKKEKGAKSSSGTGKYLKRAQDKKAYVAKAKKAGFKSTQDYTNTMARYGGEDNYKKGKGLGT